MSLNKEQRKYNKRAAAAGRQAYKKARLKGASVAKAARIYTSAFLKVWKKSPSWRKSQDKYTASPKKKAANRRYLYGLSDDAFQEMRREQKNRCAICKKKFTKTPSVDHKKGTRICRGLLCRDCNFLIGLAKESKKILLSAVRYLRRQ